MADEIKRIVEDVADEEDECEEERPQRKEKDLDSIAAAFPQKKGGSDNYIDFMSDNLGQDFALRIRGKDMNACVKIFDKLYSKIKKDTTPKPSKNDGAYH